MGNKPNNAVDALLSFISLLDIPFELKASSLLVKQFNLAYPGKSQESYTETLPGNNSELNNLGLNSAYRNSTHTLFNKKNTVRTTVTKN